MAIKEDMEQDEEESMSDDEDIGQAFLDETATQTDAPIVIESATQHVQAVMRETPVQTQIVQTAEIAIETRPDTQDAYTENLIHVQCDSSQTEAVCSNDA